MIKKILWAIVAIIVLFVLWIVVFHTDWVLVPPPMKDVVTKVIPKKASNTTTAPKPVKPIASTQASITPAVPVAKPVVVTSKTVTSTPVVTPPIAAPVQTAPTDIQPNQTCSDLAAYIAQDAALFAGKPDQDQSGEYQRYQEAQAQYVQDGC